jgi:hypothetical protein
MYGGWDSRGMPAENIAEHEAPPHTSPAAEYVQGKGEEDGRDVMVPARQHSPGQEEGADG